MGKNGTPDSPGEEEGRRPTPVRVVMEGAEDGENARRQTIRTIHDPKTGRDWIVTVTGRSAAGILPLRTVSLMELGFAAADAPDRPLRVGVQVGESLAELPEEELLACLARSEPFREPMTQPNDQEGKQRRRKGRRPPSS